MKFDISLNALYAEGTKTIAEALKGNQTMTELSISSNNMDWDGSNHGEMSGVTAISNAIPTMGALTFLDLSSNGIPNDQKTDFRKIYGSKSIGFKL